MAIDFKNGKRRNFKYFYCCVVAEQYKEASSFFRTMQG
jgi:hypothetical protein